MTGASDITEDVRKLVIFRLESLPPDKNISIGSYGDFSKDELITHVKKGDDIGKKIIEVEMTFLRALKEGIL
ncbi:hypothetical protein HYV82_05650 [Candidatus Woesearchaeota archaeon]|nr:hypothetical protein [Candidatus Woesearchaeota archaeon]